MGNIIRHRWHRADGDPLAHATIVRASDCPEGIDIERVRAVGSSRLALSGDAAHVVSLISGEGTLETTDETLRLRAGVHAFVPLAWDGRLLLDAGAAAVRVSSQRARGAELRLRDEAFVAAAAVEGHALRWVLTPQYLSRRVFLHHDAPLLSGSDRPLSWFHTTMFDVEGLAPNADGESVFKMSYDSRTEINVCYAVEGEARVRMAEHPYVGDAAQAWGPWARLDGEASYHLDEEAIDPDSGVVRVHRNKHEVFARGGFVSLYCSFDPAPTGVERHQPGSYSDYEPLEQVMARSEYAVHQREMARLDAMVDALSWARARGTLAALRGSETWATYTAGRAAQRGVEAALIASLSAEGRGRDRWVARWRSSELP